MIPSLAMPSVAPTTATQTVAKPAPSVQADGARSSMGETGPAQLRAEIANSIDPPAQGKAAAALLNDASPPKITQKDIDDEAPAGPPPAFDETILARQARVALDPTNEAPQKSEDAAPPVTIGAPPSPTERAESAVAETRAIAEPSEATLDQRG